MHESCILHASKNILTLTASAVIFLGVIDLNERQKQFIDAYIQNGGNAADAARKAGYSKSVTNVAARLLKKGSVQREINQRLKDLESSRVAETQEVLEHLTAVIRGEVSEEVISSNGKKFELRVGEKDRLRAADMILRVRGEYRDKLDVKVDVAAQFVDALKDIWQDD